MDEQKKNTGRPTIYTGRENGYVKSGRTERSFAEREAGKLTPERADVPQRELRRGTEPEQADALRKKSRRGTKPEQADVPQKKRQRGTEPEQAGVPQKKRQRVTEPEQADVPQRKRHREMETEARMRMLWGILGALVAILITAIIYEVVLGYGTKETGAERMEKMRQEKLLKEPESEDERGTETSAGQTEAAESDSEAGR